MKTGFVGFAVATGAVVCVLLSGCSKNEEIPAVSPAEESAAVPADAPQAAADETAGPSTMEAAHSAMVEGVVDVKQVAAEAEKETADAVEQMETQAGDLQQQAAMQEKAATLAAQYAPQLDMLKTSAASVKELIDRNAATLPEGLNAKYQELNAMLPRLAELMSSLRNYQGGDLASIATNLQRDFEKTKTLLAEVRAMLPAESS